MTPTPKIIFLPVSTNQNKIGCICHHVHMHFDRGENILIMAPEQALGYLDELLWKYPADSFLPHVVSKIPCKEKIVLTSSPVNLNEAQILINLCTDACPIADQFKMVYELYDETQPEKLELSRKRQQIYREKGYIHK